MTNSRFLSRAERITNMSNENLSRRSLLQATVAAGAAASLTSLSSSTLPAAEEIAMKGNIKHSIVFWCFNVAGDMWDIDKTCSVAKSLGCQSVEICGPAEFPTIKKHGLTCAMAANGMPGAPFMKGLNNPAYQDQVISVTSKTIEDCAAAGVPSVIAFTGYKWNDAEDPNSGDAQQPQQCQPQSGLLDGFHQCLHYAPDWYWQLTRSSAACGLPLAALNYRTTFHSR